MSTPTPASVAEEVEFPIVVEAIYEDGVLKPTSPLPLPEKEKVRVTVINAVNLANATYGLLGWKGDPAVIERIAMDPEFSIEESK